MGVTAAKTNSTTNDAERHARRDAGAIEREVGAIDQLDVCVGQGGEHDVAMKTQHGVAAVQGLRCGGVFPHHVFRAQRRNSLCVMRVGSAMQSLEELAREGPIDDLWHGVLIWTPPVWQARS
jgi:hypothetical protein